MHVPELFSAFESYSLRRVLWAIALVTFFNFAEVTKYKIELEIYYNITQMRISTGTDTSVKTKHWLAVQVIAGLKHRKQK